MQIKQLEIHGFKSFVERTLFEFGRGISGIVGPNGCGKSNVLDAVKWVLGEQNPRTLRGRSMSDVIFSGSEHRAAVGLAEVSMTFTNEGGAFAGVYAALPELQVTRRLYRNGDSEYLINRMPVRLRDIHGLFMDTGVGARAYAIIEQGRIGQIISARPEDRRKLIEEAAGITRYKARRDEALRQLDQSAQNLERVTDLLAELTRQMKSLERQAKKAKAYQELRTEAGRAEIVVALLRYRHLTRERDDVDRRGQRLVDEENESTKRIADAERALEEIRKRLGDESRRLGSLREELGKAEKEASLLENTITHRRRELEGLKGRREELAAERKALNARLAEVVERNRGVVEENRILEEEIQRGEASLKEGEQRRKTLIRERKTLVQRSESGRSAIVGHLTAVARHRNNLANLERRRAELSTRMEHNQEEEFRLKTRLKALEEQLGELEDAYEAHREGCEQTRETKDSLENEVERSRAEQKRLAENCRRTREELHKAKSRLHSLEELERSLEGYDAGVRALLKDYGGHGILGTVADHLRVPAELESAVEALVGPRIQYVVVEDERRAEEGAAFLRAGASGRAGFLPLTAPLPTLPPLPDDDAIGDALLDRLAALGEPSRVARILCGNAVLIRSLDDAWRLFRQGHRAYYVTESGEVLEPSGLCRGGRGDASGGILRRRSEMTTLSGTIKRLERSLEGAEDERARLEARSEDLERELAALREQLHRHELDLLQAEKDLKQAKVDMERERSHLRLRTLDARSLGAQLEELTREAEEASRRLAEEEKARLIREDEMRETQKAIEALDGEVEALQANATALKVNLTEKRTRLEENRHAIRRLTKEKGEIEEAIERAIARAREAEASEDALIREVAESNRNLERARRTLAELGDKIKTTSMLHGSARKVLEQRERALAEARAQHTEINRLLTEAVRRSSELNLELDHLHKSVQEKFQGSIVPLSAMLDAAPGRIEEEAARRAPLDSMEIPSGDEHPPLRIEAGILATLRDVLADASSRPFLDEINRLEERASDARIRMSKMGEVNLAAVEEFRILKERFDFTKEQEADLQKSIASIKAAIQRINRTSRERFREAFNLINGHFQEIFPKLFLGGNGRLVLVDESNLLESGVDIVVQPPGKKLQNMNLLSGGEKAMTAVALIFAIFMVRPSPFCILDEVDAPLDEANTGRFQEVIRELSERSQFIVITHNKRTMEIADTLYGVTMDEPGVSRLVSVDLSELP